MSSGLNETFRQEDYISADRIVALANEAQQSGCGFSAIRFNDGEGIFYGYPDNFSETELRQILNIWWGRTDQDVGKLAELRRELGDAVRGATVLGTPPLDTAQGKFLRTLTTLSESGLIDGQALALARLHRDLVESDAFSSFMRRQKQVVLITCRDVEDKIRALYGISDISVISIPEEAAFARKALEKNHFPERYEQILAELDAFPKGRVAIIGAGVCGKVYAERIRRRNGLAFDLGSILDLWAGRATRGFIGKGPVELGSEEKQFIALQKKGNGAEKQNNFQEALDIRRRLVEISPYHGKSHFDLARMAQKVGFDDDARRHARIASELRPENKQFAALFASLEKDK